MIIVISYGMGNLRSIEKALVKLNTEFKVSNTGKDIEAATHLILPGVGFFEEGMNNLRKLGLIDLLNNEVLKKRKPFLGICLGMQLLFNSSEEGGLIKGLGFIDGDVKKFKFNKELKLKIPHVGWNEVFGESMSNISLFNNIEQHSNFYFVHSYHATLNENINHCYTDYGYNFVSVVQKDNIYGTQFHPEKSQKKGLEILKNFIELRGENAKE